MRRPLGADANKGASRRGEREEDEAVRDGHTGRGGMRTERMMEVRARTQGLYMRTNAGHVRACTLEKVIFRVLMSV